MEIETIKKTLEEIGFDEKETQVYLALAKIGETTATKISKETNIERTLVYYIIEKLINKGLVSFKLKNNVKYYSAANPEKIVEELKEKELKLKGILPALQTLMKQPYEEEVKVDIYKGVEGMKAVLNDIFKSKERIFLVFGEQGQAQKNYPIIYKQYLKRLERERKKENVLVREDLRGKIEKSKNSFFKYLPKELISPVTVLIYNSKIQVTIWEKPMFNILITSKKVSDSFRSYFNHFWAIAKK